MKKLALRMRLTLMTAFLMAIMCLSVSLIIGNSALVKFNEIEDMALDFNLSEGENMTIQISLSDMLPDFVESIDHTRRNFVLSCIFVTFIVILVGASATWFLTGIALKPLMELTGKISSISENNLSERIREQDTKDEIKELTVSFNNMLERLESAFSSQKQFTANAAHELRTPLAVMQTRLEVIKKNENADLEDYKEGLSDTLIQVERLSKLVNTLLEMLSLNTVEVSENVELETMIEEIICDLTVKAEERNISLIQNPGNGIVKGSDGLIYRAIYNLIENAIKYNNEGGTVTVSVEKANDTVKVKIKDTGSGIERDNWNNIFEPFYRVDKSRSRKMGGAGLGLALVKSIATVQGGNVYISESSSEGTEFVLEFCAP